MNAQMSLADAKRAVAVGSYSERHDAENQLSQVLGQGISREEYEAACARDGVMIWTDDQVWQERGGMVPETNTTPLAFWLRWALARQRYNTLRVERPAAVIVQPATATCNRCGRTVAKSALMSSSRGLICPRCYDRE